MNCKAAHGPRSFLSRRKQGTGESAMSALAEAFEEIAGFFNKHLGN
jgi:hypothetical protein